MTRKYRSMEERLLANSITEYTGYKTECWLWIGADNGGGYPRMSVSIRRVGDQRRVKKASAHRVSYETFKGSIPEGFEVDHKCQMKRCIAPDHLQAISKQQNRALVQGRRPNGQTYQDRSDLHHDRDCDQVDRVVGPAYTEPTDAEEVLG